MNVKKHASGDINTHGGGEIPPCTGLTPDALPEVQKPVLQRIHKQGCPQEVRCRKATTNRVKRENLLWLSRCAKAEKPMTQLLPKLSC